MAESVLQESISEGATLTAFQPEDRTLTKWQKRLLPLMSRMIIGLTLFFFVASFAQLAYLHRSIENSPQMNVSESLSLLSVNPRSTPQEVLAASKLKALVTLEAASLQRNYHQANVLLMSRVWMHYLGFVTGMILALVGATFILGKLQVTTSELSAKSEVATLSFKSASPGIILATLGSILMITTVVTNHRIEVKDSAVYIRELPSSVLAEPLTPLPLPPPPPKIDEINRLGR